MILAAIATIVGSTLQSATGFGFALVLGPALFGVYEPEEAVTTLLVLGATQNLLVLFTERRPRMIMRDRLGVLLLWALPGLVAGALILAALSKATLQVAVGVAVVVAAVVQARGRTASPTEPGAGEPAWAAPGVGLVTGVLTTTTSTSGPPLVLWFQHLGFSPGEFRDSLAAAFLVLSTLGVVALEVFGHGAQSPGAAPIAGLLALTALGHFAGRLLFERLNPDRFRAIGLVLVVLAGIASAVAGFSAA